MANSLLDFVMALVRDPGAAARYGADPVGALADAQLAGVTMADVQNLIPVVTDSLAMSTPAFGAAVDTADVWTSGAAAAALDAFVVPHVDPVSLPAPIPQVDVSAAQTLSHDPGDGDLVASIPTAGTQYPGLAETHDPVDDDAWASDGAWHHAQDDPSVDHPVEHPGFDLF